MTFSCPTCGPTHRCDECNKRVCEIDSVVCPLCETRTCEDCHEAMDKPVLCMQCASSHKTEGMDMELKEREPGLPETDDDASSPTEMEGDE